MSSLHWNTTSAGLRRLLLAILCLGMLGTAAELLLLRHHEDAWQVIPLVAIAVALAVIGWHAVDRRPASLRALQLAMLLFIGSGMGGIILHFRSSRDFQLEIDASLRGRDLFWKVMQAKAPPTLAPGIMVQLGLLGLAYTYRHPAGAPPTNETTTAGA